MMIYMLCIIVLLSNLTACLMLCYPEINRLFFITIDGSTFRSSKKLSSVVWRHCLSLRRQFEGGDTQMSIYCCSGVHIYLGLRLRLELELGLGLSLRFRLDVWLG